ncbi:acyl-CoA dehydrogenase family protein [Pseudonocardia sp. WMMC193]|uniref:acyl-CoA dehydrogenase family protein n=1 Tax=Pseudonocardia sp. WMMC193 TaxID=2911965 RepID=UPI001F2CBB56|nr:acyl-CoA dehydrogenase family protein [Pseudonocardia sp. WMMC193]MCF7550820.1 acyl-CoA/acyl-ACP dehydrogenase [Pseudonocardia sp. WMMC193]
MSGPSAPERALLEATVTEIVTDHCPPEAVATAEGSWNEGLWDALRAAGLTAVGVPERLGGSGGDPLDAAAVVRVVAAHAGPVPLAEGLFPVAAGCVAAGLPFPDGPCTVAAGTGLLLRRTGAGVVLDGAVPRVPYGRVAARILVADDGAGDRPGLLALVDPAVLTLAAGDNLAGEPRDDVVAAGSEVATDLVAEVPRGTATALRRLGALARATQIAGAVDEVLALTVRYAGEREQFGRPIGRLQAVAHQIAVLAGHAAAGSAAADAAVAAYVRTAEPDDLALAVAGAKVRAGAAAGSAARIAHQVHGAIGFTQEHRLHHLTRRLWSWREEFGSEAYWAEQLGRAIVHAGADALWPTITRI